MRIYYNKHRISAPSRPSVPLYAITNDDVTTMYNITRITEFDLIKAFNNQYAIRTQDIPKIRQLPLLVPYFTTYSDLEHNFPELLI